LIAAADAAKSAPMIQLPDARLDVRQAPRHVESVFEWAIANLDRRTQRSAPDVADRRRSRR